MCFLGGYHEIWSGLTGHEPFETCINDACSNVGFTWPDGTVYVHNSTIISNMHSSVKRVGESFVLKSDRRLDRINNWDHRRFVCEIDCHSGKFILTLINTGLYKYFEQFFVILPLMQNFVVNIIDNCKSFYLFFRSFSMSS